MALYLHHLGRCVRPGAAVVRWTTFHQEIYHLRSKHHRNRYRYFGTGKASFPSLSYFYNSEKIIKIVSVTPLCSQQEQDTHGGGFDIRQSFVGMMSDVHMWDYIISPCEIQNYVDQRNFTPGNVLNWSALDIQIVDKVLIENKVTVCY